MLALLPFVLLVVLAVIVAEMAPAKDDATARAAGRPERAVDEEELGVLLHAL